MCGDDGALGELFARYRERVLRIVRLRMGPGLRAAMESTDILQETYAAALRGFPAFSGSERGTFVRWLARIAENQVRDSADRWSAQRRDLAREERLDAGRTAESTAGAADPIDAQPSPSEQLTQRELRAVYDTCVAELPERQREVVLLRDYELLEWPAVAELLGATPHAAQELYRRAQLRLAALLEARW
ncbi:MAG: sigma-70 family RNA polymerase sigma factor [Planctomycetes bacterium]|nr:sigma-70 family RNA polymerase sigma factor [Planctomycetota bacterium]